MLSVYYPSPPSAAVLTDLQNRVEGAAQVFSDRLHRDRAQMLIEGRPSLELLESMPELRWLVVPFAGVPEATLEVMRKLAASRRATIDNRQSQVSLHNLHHNAPETAELAISLLLAAAKLIVPMDEKMRRHDWTPRYDPSRVVLLEGKTAVILGFGQIGRRVARACLGLCMRAIGVRRSVNGDRDEIEVRPISDLEDLLPLADALIVCLPHTHETAGMIGEAELALLPRDAILVNIARAQIVEEEPLFAALRDGGLHSAGLDVWYRYPEAGRSVPTYYSMPETAKNTAPSLLPFHELPNVVMSPHRAGVSMTTESRRAIALAELILASAQNEHVPNRVDLDRGY